MGHQFFSYRAGRRAEPCTAACRGGERGVRGADSFLGEHMSVVRFVSVMRAGTAFAIALAIAGILTLTGAGVRPLAAQSIEQRHAEALEYIAAHADSEDMTMVPMRDGIRLYSLMLFPRGQPRQNMPAVLIHHPYLTKGMVSGFADYIASLLKNGYAVMIQNERGRYYSEGTFTYLVGSGNDGFDTVKWLTEQPWSNGKVGTLGCSSSAEEQHKLNGTHPPGLAAAVPMGSGAGIGHVGPYNEMGNFYRGGAMQNAVVLVVFRRRLHLPSVVPAQSHAGPTAQTRALLGPRARAHSDTGHRHPDLDPADQRDHGTDGRGAERSR